MTNNPKTVNVICSWIAALIAYATCIYLGMTWIAPLPLFAIVGFAIGYYSKSND